VAVDEPEEPAEVSLAELQLRLVGESPTDPGRVRLAIARVRERRAGGALALDETWIAPSLDARASPPLHASMMEARHLLRHRADALAARLPAGAGAGTGELADLLLLQAVNRHEAMLGHLVQREVLHPQVLFEQLLQAVAEFATFDEVHGRRARDLPAYRHDDLRGGLSPLMDELRRLLADAGQAQVVPIPLQWRAAGLWTARVPDASWLRDARFVLVAQAGMPAEALRRQIPAQAKIGPADRIRDLVRLHLPAIRLDPLPVAPPRLPYDAAHTYFALDAETPLWRELEATLTLALHVGGEFPGLGLELWAMRT
jgi:type VI secretion system protein ImpJ